MEPEGIATVKHLLLRKALSQDSALLVRLRAPLGAAQEQFGSLLTDVIKSSAASRMDHNVPRGTRFSSGARFPNVGLLL